MTAPLRIRRDGYIAHLERRTAEDVQAINVGVTPHSHAGARYAACGPSNIRSDAEEA